MQLNKITGIDENNGILSIYVYVKKLDKSYGFSNKYSIDLLLSFAFKENAGKILDGNYVEKRC